MKKRFIMGYWIIIYECKDCGELFRQDSQSVNPFDLETGICNQKIVCPKCGSEKCERAGEI